MPDEVADVSGITLDAIRLKCYATPTQIDIRFEPRLLRGKKDCLDSELLMRIALAVTGASRGSCHLEGMQEHHAAALEYMYRGEIRIIVNPRRHGYRNSYVVAACNAVREILLRIVASI